MLCVVHPRFVAQNVFRMWPFIGVLDLLGVWTTVCAAVVDLKSLRTRNIIESLNVAELLCRFFVVARGAQAMLIIIVAVTGQNDAASTLWDS